MNLPKKDKYGNPYLSYSQISCFLKNHDEYIERYIFDKPFEGNEYTIFGSKVGEALEKNDFSEFKENEKEVLKKCIRYDLFEYRTILKYDNFYVVGYIDTITKDLTKIIDYKTGGRNKEYEYTKKDYTQLCYYALSLRQMHGVTPVKAEVNFIRRFGNAFKGEKLKVGKESFLIDVDISMDRLKSVYWSTIEVAKNIEELNNRFGKHG